MNEMSEREKWEGIWRVLPKRIRETEKTVLFLHTQEIRIRCGRPLQIKKEYGSYFLRQDGTLTQNAAEGMLLSAADLRESISLLSAYSLYAFEEELRQGFLTIEGGHRVGFCGKAVLERGVIKTLRQINALNIRIAGERKGLAERVLPYLYEKGRLCHTLLVSPPGCGKTTLLRDLMRALSEQGTTVGVVDERGEIAPLREGMPQMEIGACTDVLEGCPKAVGMSLLLRSMSPDVIAVDELGRAEDVQAAEEVLNAGVRLLATAHGSDMADLQTRPYIKELIGKQIFERYVFLSCRNGTGTIEAILDSKGKECRTEKGGEV